MIMTSLRRHTWAVGTYFCMYGKRRPLAILWYQLHVAGGFIFKFTGGEVTTTPPHPRKTCYKKKRLGKTRVKQVKHSQTINVQKSNDAFRLCHASRITFSHYNSISFDNQLY